jgi:hypothetical protein
MSKKRHEQRLIAHITTQAHKRPKRQTRRRSVAEQSVLAGLEHEAFAEIEAPEGFRPVPTTQALMTLAEPLLEDFAVSDDADALNTILEIVVPIWNFARSTDPAKPYSAELVELIADTLSVDESEAEHILTDLLARHAHLFPSDIQPTDVRIMFMRKEATNLVAPLTDAQLALSADPLPVESADRVLVAELRQLDTMLAAKAAYDIWEQHAISVTQMCCDRFFVWLKGKGVAEPYAQHFPLCAETFISFSYQYNGVALRDITAFEVEEFFLDHLPRKVMVQPQDYVQWPPALRLLYTFLAEKGYLAEAQPLQALIQATEPEFLAMLRKQF